MGNIIEMLAMSIRKLVLYIFFIKVNFIYNDFFPEPILKKSFFLIENILLELPVFPPERELCQQICY